MGAAAIVSAGAASVVMMMRRASPSMCSRWMRTRGQSLRREKRSDHSTMTMAGSARASSRARDSRPWKVFDAVKIHVIDLRWVVRLVMRLVMRLMRRLVGGAMRGLVRELTGGFFLEDVD